MGRSGAGGLAVVQRAPALSSESKRKLKLVGAGVAAGSVAGAAVGSSVGIAALGSAMVATAPFALVGGVLGAGLVGLWSLLLGDKKRLKLFQSELEGVHAENRALRQQVSGLKQDAMNAAGEIARLTAAAHRAQPETKLWVGSTSTGSHVLYDPNCQLGYGQYVLLFLPKLVGFRVFRKDYMRGRLSTVEGAESDRYAGAYMDWLSHPVNRDIQKAGIARLIARAGDNPNDATPWSTPT